MKIQSAAATQKKCYKITTPAGNSGGLNYINSPKFAACVLLEVFVYDFLRPTLGIGVEWDTSHWCRRWLSRIFRNTLLKKYTFKITLVRCMSTICSHLHYASRPRGTICNGAQNDSLEFWKIQLRKTYFKKYTFEVLFYDFLRIVLGIGVQLDTLQWCLKWLPHSLGLFFTVYFCFCKLYFSNSSSARCISQLLSYIMYWNSVKWGTSQQWRRWHSRLGGEPLHLQSSPWCTLVYCKNL